MTFVFNDSEIGFQLLNAGLGQSLQNAKQGLSTTQSPIVLTGNGPFQLTPDQCATAVSTALVFAFATNPTVNVVLPSTASLLSLMGVATYGTWVAVRVINNNPTSTLMLIPGDSSTGVNQVGVLPLTTQTYTIAQVLLTNSAFELYAVQDVYVTPTNVPQYVTAQSANTQTPGVSNLYAIVFESILNASAQTNMVSYSTASNLLSVAGGVTVLITCTVTVLNNTGVFIQPNMEIASSGQTVLPVTNILAGSYTTVDPFAVSTLSCTVIYTNPTKTPTQWQAYISGFSASNTSVLATASIVPQFTVTQIV
jgi:hypothetical protein